jgi:hypothetical protein
MMENKLAVDGRNIGNAKVGRPKSAPIVVPKSSDAKMPKALEANPLKSTSVEIKVSEVEVRPKNLKANHLPTEGYGLEVDGKVKAQYDTAEAAGKAGLELKRKYPQIQVKVFCAKEGTRTIVELPA